MNLLNKLTLKNLKLNKKRTIVTIIGIILSVALITAVAAMFFSARESIIKYETRQKGNYHYAFHNVSESDIKYFKENRNFEKIYYTMDIGYAKLEESKNKSKPYAFIKAYEADALTNLSINLKSGRLPENDSEILIPTHLKTNGRVEYKVGDVLELEVGKRIRGEEELDQSNPFVQINEMNQEEFEKEGVVFEQIVDTVTKKFTVVGVIERPPYGIEGYSAPGYTFVTYLDSNNIKGDVSVYTRYTKEALKEANTVTANILGVDEEAFTYLYYDLGKHEWDEEEIKRQEEKLGALAYEYDANDYLIMLETGIFNDGSMKALGVVAGIVVIIIIFTSVFCIKNSFNISITEKIKQYGMLSTIGATSKQIKKNVYSEAFMLGIVGVPLGILSGLLAAYILILLSNFLIGETLGIELIYSFSWASILFAILLGYVTLYLSAWGSARKAAKISPITAIRNSEDIKINSKKIKSPKYIKKIFGVGGDVSYKNLKRNKKKYRATVISIIVCSSVFISLSAFINLAFYYIQREYDSTDYNIQLSYEIENEVATKADEIVQFDTIEDYSIWASENIYQSNDKVKFSKEYLEAFPDITEKHNSIDYNGQEIEVYSQTDIMVYRVGEHAYKDYLNQLGLKEEDIKDKGILVNVIKTGITSKDGKYEEKNITNFDYKKGDVLDFQKNTDTYDENNEAISEDVSIEIAAVTTEIPFGIPNHKIYPILIVNDAYYDVLFKAKNINHNTETISIYSNNATKLQDQIDAYLNAYNDDYTLVNIEESVKQMKSFYLLIAIFLYGFITVIALIGITNIFNTITTNMELRSREFATLKSIGMTKKEFNRMISLESFFYGTKSLIIGIPIGSVISYLIHKLLTENDTTVAFHLPMKAIIIATLAVFILITCIMKYSISKINKQNTIETIRNENI